MELSELEIYECCRMLFPKLQQAVVLQEKLHNTTEMEYYLLWLILLTDVQLIISISAAASNGKWLRGMNTQAVLIAKVDEVR